MFVRKGVFLAFAVSLVGISDGKDDGFDYPEENQDEDQHPSCAEWAKSCECIANPNYMLHSCKTSCALYGSSCRDLEDQCDSWAEQGECEANPMFMDPRCPKACALHKVRMERRKCKRKPGDKGALGETPVNAMFERIANTEWASRYAPKVLSRDPWVIEIEKFLTDAQVDGLLQAMKDSGKTFADSFELDASPEQSASRNTRRTSQSMFCDTQQCIADQRVLEVHEVVSNITGLPLEMHEQVQIVKYTPGQFYIKHHDTSDTYARSINGHRIYTMFAYLSDVPEGGGGETSFPALGLKVRPKKGSAVLWTNVKAEQPREVDDRTNHEALALNESPDGQDTLKLGANLWLYGFNYRDAYNKGCSNVPAGY